jgi:enoyl-CoA hydratase/carnithine racemase
MTETSRDVPEGDAAPRVTFDVGSDAVGVVRLTRPAKLNALDATTFEGLHAACAAVSGAIADGTVRAVLLIGEGRAFSAGLDVTMFGAQLDEVPSDAWIDSLQRAFTGFEDLPVPTVAAVHGVAIGAGCQLALAAHLRVAAPETTLGLLEARWALIPDLGGTYRLPRLIGLSRATDLAMTGRTIDAATALAWGLVDAVLDGADFPGQARAYTARLAAGPTRAIGGVPALMRRSLEGERDGVLAAERTAQVSCLRSEDFKEAVRAGVTREEPVFRGR